MRSSFITLKLRKKLIKCSSEKIRDATNAFVFVIGFLGLANAIDAMVSDRAMKSTPVGEGASYFCIKNLLAYFRLNKNIITELGLKLPHRGGITDPDFGENNRFEHGGAFMFYWAILASATAKVVYFNTLYTYVRAIEVFMSLKPIFPGKCSKIKYEFHLISLHFDKMFIHLSTKKFN